jgi:O-antigen/teichoic acid export membrane protein
VARHTAVNFAGQLSGNLISFITVPIYFHLIGAERFGVLSLAWLFLGYFSAFDLGLGRATSFRIAALRDSSAESRAGAFWTATAVNLGLGVIGGAALWVAGSVFFGHVFRVDPGLRPEMVAAVPLLAAAVPTATLSGVLYGALVGREQFLSTNIVSTLSTLLFQVFPIGVVLVFGPNLPLLLASAIFARFAALLVLMVMCRWELTRGHKARIDTREVRNLLGYGVWVTVATLASPILVFADRVAIGATLGAVAVATYTMPFQLAQRINLIPGALSTSLFPRFVPASAEERESANRVLTLTLAGVLTILVLVGIIVLAPFLDLWVGHKMSLLSAPVGRILLIGFWLNAFAYLPSMTLQAAGRPRGVALILVLQIPAYLLALYAAMSAFGLIGCAIVFCLRNAVDWMMFAWAAHRNLSGWRILLADLILLTLAALLIEAPLADVPKYAALALVLAVTIGLGWYSAPPEAKRLFATFAGRLRNAVSNA